jgi:hypothetical protein
MRENGELRYDADRILSDDQKQEWKTARDKRANWTKERKDWREGRAMDEYEDVRRDNEYLKEKIELLMQLKVAIDKAVDQTLNEEQQQVFKQNLTTQINEVAEASAGQPQ